MDLSTLAAMPVPSPMRPSMICGERGRISSGSVGERAGGWMTFDLGPRKKRQRVGAVGGRATTGGGRARGGSTHLLGADEVVAETTGLLLREHDHLDGFLGEALGEEGKVWEGREGSGTSSRASRRLASCQILFFRDNAAPAEARARARDPPTGILTRARSS